MSQQAVRAKAREIRRAFGPAAVEHIDQLEKAVASLNAAVSALVGRVEALENSVDDLEIDRFRASGCKVE